MGLRKGSGRILSRLHSVCEHSSARSVAWLSLAFILVAGAAPSASARVHASILVDAQTGKTLEAHNADSRCYPASLTKLMTLYITFQQLSTGKLTLGQELPVSAHAAAQAPTKLYLRPGERISVRSAILAITTRSANDAAVVLAEAIGGSEWKFAEMMNQRARALGLTRTTFHNASGLPNRYQKTTARDMSKLALAILDDFPQYYHFFKAESFDFRGKTIYGHDHLLTRYPGVDGMKTGYTNASGFNIVTSAVRDGHRLVGVVMGGRTARSRDRQMIALLNHGFNRVRARTVMASNHQPEKPAAPAVARYKDVSAQESEADEASRPDLGWMVQLGGRFRSRYHARRALKSASHTDPQHLGGARALVVALRGGKYLARFSNMDEETALATCRELRHKKFTCNAYQIRRGGMVMASASTRRETD
jgi:D-alanyl-D-alanine carboxypeptidase